MTTITQLELVDANHELLDAAVEDPPRLARLLAAAIATDWAVFPEALPVTRDAYAGKPLSNAPSNPSLNASLNPWGTILFLLRDPRTLVGMGGYKGAPSRDGIVEIGYAVAPAFRARGLATDAVRQMVRRGFASPSVTAIDAHTLARTGPSTRVLEKLGFQHIADHTDPDDGHLWQWRLRRP
jgi:ribosomal-protein-alanine N-acetyltransferase